MMRLTLVGALAILLAVSGRAQSRAVLEKGVTVEIARGAQEDSLLQWKITNQLDVAVYVYDVFLWGPALHVQRHGDRIVIETTPIVEVPSCPPNRFPPVLLLIVGPKRTIQGDFSDSNVKDVVRKEVSLKIAVGSEPYGVVRAAEHFASSNCRHSPYDAIVQWAAILESNSIRIGK